MEDIMKQIDCLKEKTEDTFKFYAEKKNWDPQDIECLEKAAKLYDKLQTIQMNTGTWENMKRGGMSYGAPHYPHISYGEESYRGPHYAYGHEESYMRGRDADTGRFMSRAPHYDDGRSMHSVKDQAIQRLEQLMDSAQSEYEREQVRGMIAAVEGQKR
ncbi:MAG: hypothetical protein IKU36_01640 [Bacteroidales bacterium]|nr:hypothetical protein [Clostridiales bacterium]MBR5298932.1 hypothetical protein [Bacteroidales bacterium]